jgi:Ni/Fe-hydrogenase subunit HybB-like protein
LPESLGGNFTFEEITDRIARLVLKQKVHGKNWLSVFLAAYLFANVLLMAVGWLFQTGVGVLGNNMPVAWGVPIATFVWWVGIGHAGTFISAVLFIMRQKWRGSINRLAEAMTIVAVLCAGMYPVLHLGRPWVAYWLAPYPNRMGVWPQFRSPLVWDFFAVMTYLIVSILFWFIALVPDLATIRDRAKNPIVKRIYAVFSFGWCGDCFHWARFQQAYGVFAGITAALVISVHSIVGLDFAVAQVPGWHETITPPWFVAGAVFSGFAMLAVLVIPIRSWYGLKEIVTADHLEWIAKVLLLTSLIVGYSYIMEIFTAFYRNTPSEVSLMMSRLTGVYRPLYGSVVGLNALLPQIFWSKKIRRNVPVLFIASLLIMVGLWLEQYEVVTVGLRRGFMPSAWHGFSMTFWDWAILLGTLGFFFMMMLIFVRFVPAIAIFEVKEKAKPEKGLPRFYDVTSGGVASYADEQHLLEAARKAKDAGLVVRAFTPRPVKGLAQLLGFREYRLPWAIFIGGVCGAAVGWAAQWYINVVDYPLNSGGRAYDSMAAFVPVAYECTVLGAVLFGVAGLFYLNGFPHIADPVFEYPEMERATQDRFLIFVEDHPEFSRASIEALLMGATAQPEPVASL